jgi:hypothetical protein
MEKEWNRNDWQGRSKNQITNNLKIAHWSVTAAVTLFSAVLIIRILNKIFF